MCIGVVGDKLGGPLALSTQSPSPPVFSSMATQAKTPITASTSSPTAISSHATSGSNFTSGRKSECESHVADVSEDGMGRESRRVSFILCGGSNFSFCCCTTGPQFPPRHLAAILHPRRSSSLSSMSIYFYPDRNITKLISFV